VKEGVEAVKTAAKAKPVEADIPDEAATPWASLESDLGTIRNEIRGIKRKIEALLEYDKPTNRYNHKFARGFDADHISKRLDAVCYEISQGMPEELNGNGYLTHHEVFVKKERVKHARA
jgi:hypothetical protein